MPISFANIPSGVKIPLYWVEIDPSMAGLPTINLRALLVGVKIADGQRDGRHRDSNWESGASR